MRVLRPSTGYWLAWRNKFVIRVPLFDDEDEYLAKELKESHMFSTASQAVSKILTATFLHVILDRAWACLHEAGKLVDNTFAITFMYIQYKHLKKQGEG